MKLVQQRHAVLVCLIIIALLAAPSLQTYYFESIAVTQSTSGCKVYMTETFVFRITSGYYTLVTFPFYKDALYTTSPTITGVSVTSSQAPVLSVDTSSSSKITVQTNATGRCTFVLSYTINGYLESTNGVSTLRWGTISTVPIDLITVTQTLPATFSSTDPSYYATSSSSRKVTYSRRYLPETTPFLVQTKMNSYSVYGCASSSPTPTPTPTVYIGSYIWVVVFPFVFIIFVVLCVVCTIRARIMRRNRLLARGGLDVTTSAIVVNEMASAEQHSNQEIMAQSSNPYTSQPQMQQGYTMQVQQGYPPQMQQGYPPQYATGTYPQQQGYPLAPQQQQYYSPDQPQPPYSQQQQQQQQPYYSPDQQPQSAPQQYPQPIYTQYAPQPYSPEQPNAPPPSEQPHIYRPPDQQ